MRFPPLSILFVTLFFSSLSSAEDVDTNERECRAQGFIVLYNWYQLDTCLKYQGIKPEVAIKARYLISTAYPNLQVEIETNSPFAAKAKEAGTTWSPFDFSNNQNSELLTSICKTSVDFLHLASSREDWKSALSCWR
jgi:hypothetical protein